MVSRLQPCYPHRDIGFTRWAFDNAMWLAIRDSYAFREPESPRHLAELERLREQVLRQWRDGSGARCTRVEGEGRSDRELTYWVVEAQGPDGQQITRHVPRPVLSDSQHEGNTEDDSEGILVFPIRDIDPNRPPLGMMRFTRRRGQEIFAERDTELLESVARHCAQVILREQFRIARERERELLLKVVAMEPGAGRRGFKTACTSNCGACASSSRPIS